MGPMRLLFDDVLRLRVFRINGSGENSLCYLAESRHGRDGELESTVSMLVISFACAAARDLKGHASHVHVHA